MSTKTRYVPNLDACGFVCSSCNFRLLISDLQVSMQIVETFNNAAQVDIACPECGLTRAYRPSDLIWFLSGGREVPIAKSKFQETMIWRGSK